MAVDGNEGINRAHKNAIEIVKSSTSLVTAVNRATTHAAYWIDATGYPPRTIRDPHEPRIKLCYLNLVRLLTSLNRGQLRADSKCFTEIRLNGPYRSVLGVFPNAHFAAWELGEQIESFVSQVLRLSVRAKRHLFLPCLPRESSVEQGPPIGRYSLKSPNWLERRIRKHFKQLSGIAQRFPDAVEWHSELEWEYSRMLGKSTDGQNTPQLAVATPPSPGAQRVVLRERSEGPIVLGKPKKKLTNSQYDVVKALLHAGDEGLTKDELVEKSRHADAVNILKRLSHKDPDWEKVIHLAGITGGGYRIN